MSCSSPGGAGEERERSSAATPEPREREEAATDRVAGEVLRADPEGILVPVAPYLVEGEEDHLAQDGF